MTAGVPLILVIVEGGLYSVFQPKAPKRTRLLQWRQVAAYRHAGNGQSFLFRFNPDGSLDAYDWTGMLTHWACSVPFID